MREGAAERERGERRRERRVRNTTSPVASPATLVQRRWNQTTAVEVTARSERQNRWW
ncbi:hypothetical protein HanPI659440_Chr02g0046091 [Helianthus annuus]|nr:hypothetical protein HanPI659440_Chr02g0046091 [Helianthus annuus]